MSLNCVVVLDVDGTLIPILVDFEKLRSDVRRLLGVDHPLRPLGESLARLQVSDEAKRRAWELIEREEELSLSRLNPSDLGENLLFLELLRSMGADVYFVTMRSSKTARMLFSKLGVNIDESKVVTRDLSSFRVEQLRAIVERAGGRRVVFLGDTIYDEEAARAVGVDFIMVRSFRELPGKLESIVELCRF
ncbi:MAG: HAD family hydrolase [Desulfurococcaceae archaeon]